MKETDRQSVLKERETHMKKLTLLLAFLGMIGFGAATQANAGVHVGIGIGGPGYYGGYYGPGYYGPAYPYYGYYGYPYPYYGYYGHPYYYHHYYGGYGHYGHGGYHHHR